MKAAVRTRCGSPDVVGIAEVATPVPGDDDIRIQIHATTVNRTDCGYLRGKPFIIRFFSGIPRPRRTILGNEFSGKIDAVGRNTTSFKVGDKVFGYNEGGFGGHAQFMTMPEAGLVTTMPANLTYEEAAPGTEGAHYALSMIRRAGIRPGHRIVVNGATGAIGSAAVQLVKHIGCFVTAVANTPNLELVAALGADEVIDYTTTDFTVAALRDGDGERYDCVIDAVGKSTFARCRRLLKPGGVYVSSELGPYAQNLFLAVWTARFGRRKVIFPIPQESKDDVVFFRQLIEAGEFKPVIDRTYPLDDIVEAYRYVETGQKTGNVVIRVVPPGELDR